MAMNLIESHRSGLAEELASEARWMAGRPRDHVPRAIAYYHLYAHSGGRHLAGLVAAWDTLDLDRLLGRLARRAGGAWWQPASWWRGRAVRAARTAAAGDFAERCRTLDAERCADMVFAYRLAATERLRGHAGERLGAERVAALAGGDGLAILRAETAMLPAERQPEALMALAAALPGKGMRRIGRQAAACLGCDEAAIAALGRGRDARLARSLRGHRDMPRHFRDNPGQAYFALLNAMGERRRRDRVAPEAAMAEESVRVE